MECRFLEIYGAHRTLGKRKGLLEIVKEVELDEIIGKPEPSQIRNSSRLEESSQLLRLEKSAAT